MVREIKNKVYYIKTYSEDDDVDFMSFVESDNLETVKKYIAENFSKSHHFFIEDLQYHECYYNGLISELKFQYCKNCKLSIDI